MLLYFTLTLGKKKKKKKIKLLNKDEINIIQHYETAYCDKKPNAWKHEIKKYMIYIFQEKKNQNTLQLKQV